MNKSQAQLDKFHYLNQGRYFLINEQYSDAIHTLNTILNADATLIEGYFLRGVAKYNLGDLIGAEQDFNMAIRYNPVYAIAYNYRAIIRSRLGNYDDAINDFNMAIDVRPDIIGTYFSRGVTFLLTKRYEDAIDDFSMFISRNSKYPDGYINRGICHLMLKDTLSALEDFNTAIKRFEFNADPYNRRGMIYLAQKRYEEAMADFNKAIELDSTYAYTYFNRAFLHSENTRPVEAINDFSKVISLDSTNVISYFNRAILRSQIGDYNGAIDDYTFITKHVPNNVLVYFNRANILSYIGYVDEAIADYTKAIELYPDFANAYLARAALKYQKRDMRGAKRDKDTGERKIAEYRAKLSDDTFFSDISYNFDRLISLEDDANGQFEKLSVAARREFKLRPLYKFTFVADESVKNKPIKDKRVKTFLESLNFKDLVFTNISCDYTDAQLQELSKRELSKSDTENLWFSLFEYALNQSVVKQFTNSIEYYTEAIRRNSNNAFIYINRSAAQSEMIDFISSLDNENHHFVIDTDPAKVLKNDNVRTYDYREAISDLDQAAQLMPDFAYIYYNRANLKCISGDMSGALEDYTHAIKLYPDFGDAYYNRGLIQLYLKETKKGLLDISKSGELGVSQAYDLLKKYGR